MTDKDKPTLDGEDLDLWRRVTENLKPLSGGARNLAPGGPPGVTDKAAPQGAKYPEQEKASQPSAPTRPPARRTQPKPTAMESRRVRRLARGATAFDAKIDLHGMTQRQAHASLLRFLQEAHRRGNRNVLVVTGKGRAGGNEPGREAPGVIRRNIGHWLDEPGFAELVAAWSPARQHHGGDGALYVQVRRNRV